MKIGLAYDLKQDMVLPGFTPDDILEEYDSAETVSLIAVAVKNAGHEPVHLGGGRNFLKHIMETRVDFVFNIAEGRGAYRSREAQIPSVLEMLDIPYSGSDPQTLAVSLDKPLTKHILQAAGVVSTPKWRIFRNKSDIKTGNLNQFCFPVFIKPAFEGSSKGIRFSALASSADQAFIEISRLFDVYQQAVLVEEFIDGEEVTCGLIGNFCNAEEPLVLPMRVVPRHRDRPFIYSLEIKRDYSNQVDYEFPARLPNDVLERIREQALRIFRVLGCRDFSRIDFRISNDGTPWFLEINPLPGLSLDSDLYIIARRLGWDHDKLIRSILDAALKRYPILCALV